MSIQIIPKHKLKTRTNIEMIEVKQIGKYDYDVLNLKNGHRNMVRWSRKENAIVCTCEYGTQESSSGVIAEDHRCKHVRSVRQYLEKEK